MTYIYTYIYTDKVGVGLTRCARPNYLVMTITARSQLAKRRKLLFNCHNYSFFFISLNNLSGRLAITTTTLLTASLLRHYYIVAYTFFTVYNSSNYKLAQHNPWRSKMHWQWCRTILLTVLPEDSSSLVEWTTNQQEVKLHYS